MSQSASARYQALPAGQYTNVGIARLLGVSETTVYRLASLYGRKCKKSRTRPAKALSLYAAARSAYQDLPAGQFTTAEIAEQLGVSEAAVWAYAKRYGDKSKRHARRAALPAAYQALPAGQYTAGEIAERLGVSEGTLRKLARRYGCKSRHSLHIDDLRARYQALPAGRYTNVEIARLLGVNPRTVVDYARAYGRKSKRAPAGPPPRHANREVHS